MFIGTVPKSIENFRNRQVTINRPLYREEDIQHLCDDKEDIKKPLITNTVSKCKDKCMRFSCKDVLRSIASFFPILAWLPNYKKSYILKDFSAGLTLGVMQIPQGMAYGMLTTLPAIYGLYVSFVPVIVYFIMGSSMHISIGTFAIISLMVGETVESRMEELPPLHPPNGTTVEELQLQWRVRYAVTTSFYVGIFQVIFGILHFNFITWFLSDALISGFTTGAGFHIFSSQVKHLFGVDVPRKETSGFFSLFKIYGYIFSRIKEVNYVSLIIGVVATIILFVVKYFTQKYKRKIKFPIPAELIVVALGTGLSYGFNFHERYKVKILKNVPKSLPPISYPVFDSSKGIVDCVTIAIVSYAISVSVAKAFAKKHKMKIDTNQELYAYGVCNIVSSFFSCFVCSASLSRSLIQENLGSTQLSSLISCSLILLVLTLLAPIFQPLPNAILAAVVLVALKGLFRQFSVVRVLFKISKIDTFIWIISFVSVVLFGVDYGLAVGFSMNLCATVLRASRPSSTLMGNLEGTEIYTQINIDSATEIPGVKIFRFHAPLFYSNVEYFQETLYKATVSPNNYIKWPVPDCYQTMVKEKNATIGIINGVVHHNGYVPPEDPVKFDELLDSASEVEASCSSAEHDAAGDENFKTIFVPPDKPPFCPMHTIVLDCSQISYTDSMGVSALIAICGEYKSIGVDVFLSNCPASLLRTLQAGGFTSLCDTENIFVTTHCAVNHAYNKLHTEGICDPSTPDKVERTPWELVTIKPDGDDDTITTAQDGDEEDTTSLKVV